VDQFSNSDELPGSTQKKRTSESRGQETSLHRNKSLHEGSLLHTTPIGWFSKRVFCAKFRISRVVYVHSKLPGKRYTMGCRLCTYTYMHLCICEVCWA